MKNIMILGSNGYIGNALVQHLLFDENNNIYGIDNDSKALLVDSLNSVSAIPISTCTKKANIFEASKRFKSAFFDITEEYEKLFKAIKEFKPDVIVNLAQMPSGPFSHISHEHANYTLMNNIIGTNNVIWAIKEYVPECHYITIGTMGEYQHDINTDIPEGYFSFDYKGRTSKDTMFPRRPGSIYHLTKVASTNMIDLYCRLWNIKVTDIMQGVVYGLYTPETEKTKEYSSFFVDECFGTVLNRFIMEAILKTPLTVFGEGLHSRGFISLNDSVQALSLAIENPPTLTNKPRVWNQLSEWKKMNELAELVQKIGNEKFGLDVKIDHVDSLRKENTTDHYYNIDTSTLLSLGYKPTRTFEEEIEYCMSKLLENKEYIDKHEWSFDAKIKF